MKKVRRMELTQHLNCAHKQKEKASARDASRFNCQYNNCLAEAFVRPQNSPEKCGSMSSRAARAGVGMALYAFLLSLLLNLMTKYLCPFRCLLLWMLRCPAFQLRLASRPNIGSTGSTCSFQKKQTTQELQSWESSFCMKPTLTLPTSSWVGEWWQPPNIMNGSPVNSMEAGKATKRGFKGLEIFLEVVRIYLSVLGIQMLQ